MTQHLKQLCLGEEKKKLLISRQEALLPSRL